MFLWIKQGITSILEYLVPHYFMPRARVVFLGYDNSGKTTLLHRLKTGNVTQTMPTTKPNIEEIDICNVHFTIFDLSGHGIFRKEWKSCSADNMDAIVFMIDGSDPHLFGIVKEELEEILKSQVISSKPIAILVNKIDLTTCVSEDEIIEEFDLADKVTAKNGRPRKHGDQTRRPLEVFPVSVIRNAGYEEAFEWIAEQVKSSRTQNFEILVKK